jgi:hypothetical protein
MNIRRYVLPSLLVLLLGGIYAGAQTINKALQLSQDNTGAFSVDSFLGVYFPGHILSPTGGARPAPSVTGTGTPTIAGTDVSGLITMGSSATTAIVLFGTAFGSVPNCVISPQNAFTTTNIAYTLATTSMSLTQNSTSGNKINYWCVSAS